MDKKIRLLDYADRPKEITIKDFEKVKLFIFQIVSGDGTLRVRYNDGHEEYFDSSDDRLMDFHDGTWVIEPKDIDVLNRMKDHDDTEELDKVG